MRNLIRYGEWSEPEWRILLNWLSRILTNTTVSGSGEHPQVGSSQKEISEKLDSSLIKGESLSYSTMCSVFSSSSFHIFSLPLVFNTLIIKWLETVFSNFSYWASCISVFEERFCLILSLSSPPHAYIQTHTMRYLVVRIKSDKTVSLQFCDPLSAPTFLKIFIWLHWVLVAAYRIFIPACWDLYFL